jgi:hypothetical protein
MQAGFARFNMNGTEEVRTIMSKSRKKENLDKNNAKLSFRANSSHMNRLKFEKNLALCLHVTLTKWSNWHVEYPI